ncbi:unnamed protein product, partial [Closterium sp. NIES-54]
ISSHFFTLPRALSHSFPILHSPGDKLTFPSKTSLPLTPLLTPHPISLSPPVPLYSNFLHQPLCCNLSTPPLISLPFLQQRPRLVREASLKSTENPPPFPSVSPNSPPPQCPGCGLTTPLLDFFPSFNGDPVHEAIISFIAHEASPGSTQNSLLPLPSPPILLSPSALAAGSPRRSSNSSQPPMATPFTRPSSASSPTRLPKLPPPGTCAPGSTRAFSKTPTSARRGLERPRS